MVSCIIFKRIILLASILLYVCCVYSQSKPNCSYTIEGYVYDRSSEKPLPFVKVQIVDTEIGSLSDESGYFLIENLCEKEYDLVFSSLGYKVGTHHHDFHHPSLSIYLVPNEFTLDNIIMEAERSNQDIETLTTSKLTADQLKKVSTESLGEVLSQITGVNMLSTGQNVAKPIIHGLHSNRVLVMNNGIRHEFQNWGLDHAPEIDPSLVDQIEVVKGAATVRYGPEAMGGVILIKPPSMELNTDLTGEISLTGKSNGRSGEGTVELKKGFKWISVFGGGSYVKQGDLSAPDYLLTNTGKNETSYYGGFRIHPLAELDIEGYYSHFDQELGILRGSVFGNLEDLERAISAETPLFTDDFSYDIDQPKQIAEHDLYKAKLSYTGGNQYLSIQYGYQINKRKEFGVRRGNAPNIDLELVSESVDADWTHPNLGSLSGKLGFQWQRQANDNLPGTNTVPFIPNYDSKRYGAYIIESINLGQHVLELGLRFDHFDAFIVGREPDNTIYQNRIIYNNASGTLGLKLQLNEFASFQTNVGTAWRPPNVAELYRFGQHSFFIEYGIWRYTIDERFDFVSTSEGILDEEDLAVPAEIGYKWINTFYFNKNNFRLEATLYANLINNYIYSRPGGLTRTPRGFFVFFLYDQADAIFWGTDITIEKTHSSQFTSLLKLSYLNAQQFNPKDQFANLPPPRIDYGLTYTPLWGQQNELQFGIDMSYVFEQPLHPRIIPVNEFLNPTEETNRFSDDVSDFDILAPPEGYFLTHFFTRAARKNLFCQFQIKNLFNVRYRNNTDRIRYFADDLGRNFILSIGYRL